MPKTEDLDIKVVDYGKIENNEGLKRCMVCGGMLPLNDDGSERFRIEPEACTRCIHANMNKVVDVDGVIRDIDECCRIFDEETGVTRYVKK